MASFRVRFLMPRCTCIHACRYGRADYTSRDGLNLAMASSPPLRVLDAAGAIIGIVSVFPFSLMKPPSLTVRLAVTRFRSSPHWYFGVAGAGLQVVARAGMVTVAKTLSDRYLQRANATFFAPRGLRVRVCRTGAVHQLLGLRESDNDGGKSKSNTAENIALHLPIVRKIYNRMASPIPTSGPSTSYNNPNAIPTEYPNSVTRRRIEALEGRALPLAFSNLPPAPSSDTLMQRAQEMSAKMEQRKAQEGAMKTDRNKQLLAIAEGRADMSSIREQFVSASA